MQELRAQIARTEKQDIDLVLKAVLTRYRELFPQWEICTFSLDRASDRNTQLDRIIAMLESMKNMP